MGHDRDLGSPVPWHRSLRAARRRRAVGARRRRRRLRGRAALMLALAGSAIAAAGALAQSPAPLPPPAGGESWATAPAAANAIVATANVTPARPRSMRRRRRVCAPRRSRDARSDLRQGRGELRSLSIPTEGFLRRLVAYGVSCRARAGRALRRALPAIRPRAAGAVHWVPRSPPLCMGGDSAWVSEASAAL